MRVVVTGVGIVSPLAASREGTWARLLGGQRAYAPLTLFDASDYASAGACEVRGLRVSDVAPAGEVALWSRTDAMAMVAAREALAHAALRGPDEPLDLVVGGTTGGMFEHELALAAMAGDERRREPSASIAGHPLGATAARLASVLPLVRRARTVCSACASGAHAVAAGAAWIRDGRSRRVLVGGADGLCRLTFAGFSALGAIDPGACRPFDRRRAGLNLGEAAAFLVLESEEAARARGARVIAEVAGWALGAEAHHITQPAPDGGVPVRLVREALARAGLAPADVDHVNAHGTGTRANDAMEAAALREALGADAARALVSSSKGQVGHTLGAAGALEAAFAALAVERGEVPPTAGLEEVDDACRLAHVLARGRAADVRVALSTSFGFGGVDAVLAFARAGYAPEAIAAPPRAIVITAARVATGRGSFDARDLAAEGAGQGSPGGGDALAAGASLDGDRARRLDRAARALVAVAERALLDAASRGRHAPARVGFVDATDFGSADATAAYLARMVERGARQVSPSAFPALVPSSPAAQASIYLGLQGPVLTAVDTSLPGEAGFETACDRVLGGDADAVVAAMAEARSEIVERVFAPSCTGRAPRAARAEGAIAVVVEEASSAAGRALARVVETASQRGAGGGDATLGLARGARPLVVVTRDDAWSRACLERWGWEGAPRIEAAAQVGDHAALFGVAVALGVSAVASGSADDVLCLGASREGFTLARLGPP